MLGMIMLKSSEVKFGSMSSGTSRGIVEGTWAVCDIASTSFES